MKFSCFVGQLKSNWRLHQYYDTNAYKMFKANYLARWIFNSWGWWFSLSHLIVSLTNRKYSERGDHLFFFFLVIFFVFLWSRRSSHYLISIDVFLFFSSSPAYLNFTLFSTFDFTNSIYPLSHFHLSYGTQNWLLYSSTISQMFRYQIALTQLSYIANAPFMVWICVNHRLNYDKHHKNVSLFI